MHTQHFKLFKVRRRFLGDEEIISSLMKRGRVRKQSNFLGGHRTDLRQKPDRCAQNGYPRQLTEIKVMEIGRIDLSLMFDFSIYTCREMT